MLFIINYFKIPCRVSISLDANKAHIFGNYDKDPVIFPICAVPYIVKDWRMQKEIKVKEKRKK